MTNFWKHLGMGLARVAKYSGQAALWASQHPEVVAAVAAASGHQKVALVAEALEAK